MKQFIYKSLILGSVLTAASCSNSEYEFDKLFPWLLYNNINSYTLSNG